RIEPDRVFKKRERLGIGRGVALGEIKLSFKVGVVGVEAHVTWASQRIGRTTQKGNAKLLRDCFRNLLLHREDVLQLAVVTLRPPLAVVSRIHQLDADSDADAGLADAALEDIRDPQGLSDRARVFAFALETKTRIAPDHAQLADLAQ